MLFLFVVLHEKTERILVPEPCAFPTEKKDLAALDNYLYKCEVTIADDDSFPTNKHTEELAAGGHSEISELSLVLQ